MCCTRILPVLVAASVALTGCADDSPSAPAPVIVSFDDGWGQIFVANVDGSGLRQITPTVADDMSDGRYGNYAALSPDGAQLAYTRGGRFIDVVVLESGEVRTVHEGGSQPVFSPDGSTIAFTSGDRISLMNADGSGAHVVAPEGSGAKFSPDGSRMIFNVNGYVVEMPATGGESKVALRDEFWNSDPAFTRRFHAGLLEQSRRQQRFRDLLDARRRWGDHPADRHVRGASAVHPRWLPHPLHQSNDAVG